MTQCPNCKKHFFPKQSKFFLKAFIFFVILCALDVFATFVIIGSLQSADIQNATDFELNPIMKFFWQNFGLVGGSVMGFLFAVGIIACVLRFYQYNPPSHASWGIGFLTGAYAIVFVLHLQNLLLLGVI